MDPRDTLLAAIAAAPDDDTPRLVYADWLDDHGDPARAEFIRVQCGAARLPPGSPPARELEARADALFTEHGPVWVGAIATAVGYDGSTPYPENPFHPFSRGYRGPDARPSFVVGGQTDPDGPHLDLTFSRGLLDLVSVFCAYDIGQLVADLFRVEPVTRLSLRVGAGRPPRPRPAGRPDDDYLARPAWPVAPPGTLRRVRHLVLEFDPSQLAADFLWALSDDPHLDGLVGLGVFAGPDTEFPFSRGRPLQPNALDALTTSRLLGSLTALGTVLDRRGLEAIARADWKPSALDLGDSPLGGAGPLLAGLPFRHGIRQLKLRHTGLTEADMAALAGSDWPVLEELDLSATALTDATARALANARWVRQLRRLEVRINQFTDAGREQLRAALNPDRLELFDAENYVPPPIREDTTDRGPGLLARVVRFLTGR